MNPYWKLSQATPVMHVQEASMERTLTHFVAVLPPFVTRPFTPRNRKLTPVSFRRWGGGGGGSYCNKRLGVELRLLGVAWREAVLEEQLRENC